MNTNLENPGQPIKGLETGGIEDRDMLLGLFRAPFDEGAFQISEDRSLPEESYYLVVRRGGHELRIHSTFALSTIDGRKLTPAEAEEFWRKFEPHSK